MGQGKIHGDFADNTVTSFCPQQNGKLLDCSERKLCVLVFCLCYSK